jgi:hypothetical protein
MQSMGVETIIKWIPGRINKCIDCTRSGCPVRKLSEAQGRIFNDFIRGDKKNPEAAIGGIEDEISEVGATLRTGLIYSVESGSEQVITSVRCPERLCPVGSRRADIISSVS